MTDLEFYRERAGKTIGDLIRAVLAISVEEDAARFYHGHVADIQEQIDAGAWQSRLSAEQGAKSNIGWCFGEGMDPDHIRMWQKVCGAVHPFLFGS